MLDAYLVDLGPFLNNDPLTGANLLKTLSNINEAIFLILDTPGSSYKINVFNKNR